MANRNFDLNENDLYQWQLRWSKINFRLKEINAWYILSVLVLISILLFLGVKTKEDISFTVQDFSIKVVANDQAALYPLLFEGIVTSDVANFYSSSANTDIIVKLYLAPEARSYFNNKRVVKLVLVDARFSNIKGDLLSGNVNSSQKNEIRLISLKSCLIVGKMRGVNSFSSNVAGVLKKLSASSENAGVEKVKIILGETCALNFWLKKIFSKSPIFKKSGRYID